MKTISFIIPCFRSEGTIGAVVAEIKAEVANLPGYEYEIITVNDHSPDQVMDVLETLAHDPNIKVLSFTKNFGQHAAMLAGLKAATGDLAVFLDDDGQCPLDHLAELIEPLEHGWDVTIAKYGRKKQSLFKNMCSLVNEIAANLLIDKPREIQMGNFMALTRVIIDEVCRYSGPYPYISGLLFRSSGKILNVPMKERRRMQGSSTYTLKKLFSLWMNSFTAFSVKPLRIASAFGLFCAMGGFLYLLFIVINKLMNPAVEMGWSSIMATLLLVGGIVMFILGIIGEYIGRIYMTISETPQYVVKRKINFDSNTLPEYKDHRK